MSKEIINNGILFKQRTNPDWQEGYNAGKKLALAKLLSQDEVRVALVNVLGLARERLEQLSETENLRQSNRESLEIVADYYLNNGQAKTTNNDE